MGSWEKSWETMKTQKAGAKKMKVLNVSLGDLNSELTFLGVRRKQCFRETKLQAGCRLEYKTRDRRTTSDKAMEMVFTRGIGSQPGVAVGEEYKEISQQWGN